MSERIKGVRGNSKNPQRVKEWLKGQGGEDVEQIADDYYSDDNAVYYILKGVVESAHHKSKVADLLDIVPLPHWRATSIGKTYYYVTDDGDVLNDEEKFTILDAKRYEFGNYFQTEEEAEEYLNKIIKLLKRDE